MRWYLQCVLAHVILRACRRLLLSQLLPISWYPHMLFLCSPHSVFWWSQQRLCPIFVKIIITNDILLLIFYIFIHILYIFTYKWLFNGSYLQREVGRMSSVRTHWPELTACYHHTGQWKWGKITVKSFLPWSFFPNRVYWS